MRIRLLARLWLVPLLLWGLSAGPRAWAAESSATNYLVTTYVVAGYQVPPTNASRALFAKYTGREVTLGELVKAARELQVDYRRRGYTNVSISMAPERITGGQVTLHAFRAPSANILVSGRAFPKPTPMPLPVPAAARPKPAPHFAVKAFEVRGDTLLSTAALTAVLAKHTGTNVALTNIIEAASELQKEYRARGYPTVRVEIPQQQAHQ